LVRENGTYHFGIGASFRDAGLIIFAKNEKTSKEGKNPK
jgi:hypothetical protein